MTNREFVLDALRGIGKDRALAVQRDAPEMDGDGLYGVSGYIPAFDPARQYLNEKAGYVCRTAAGRVVRLLQPYDSGVYPQHPEELPAQWGFVWPKDPAYALPFVPLSTSPYMQGDCCTENGRVWRSTRDNNVFSPEEYPEGWQDVTEMGQEQPQTAPVDEGGEQDGEKAL